MPRQYSGTCYLFGVPPLSVAMPRERELAAVIGVWLAASHARGLPPTPERIERVRVKITAPDACLLVARRTSILAMALAEPGREEHGHGPVIDGHGHISMFFVHPSVWGRGVGGQLLDGLHRAFSRRAWTHATLWTRATNAPAQALYESRGYRRTGQTRRLSDGDRIIQYARTRSGT